MENLHTCEAVVIHCIDFRFRKILNEYLMRRFPEGYDLISVAGGVKRLLEDPVENNFVLEQLQISHRLHSSKTIVLIQHEDCGAYGGSKEFENLAREQQFQQEQLAKARAFLKERFSECDIETSLVFLSGEIRAV